MKSARAIRTSSTLTAAAIAAALVAALAGCGGSGGVTTAKSGPPQSVSSAQWDKIVAAAEKEGQVVIYSSLSNTEKTFAEFKKAYPKINVTVERAPGADLISRLDQEMAANAGSADVAFHTQVRWFADKFKADQLAALELSPEAQSLGWEKRLAGKSYAPVFSFPILLAYNTKTAHKVTSVDQLIREAGKQTKVGVLDASASPSQSSYYAALLKEYGPDTIARLAKLNTKVEGTGVSLGQALAAGEIDYVVGIPPGVIGPLKAKGAPVEQVVPDGLKWGPVYPVAALAQAPHPNAAQVFVNWLMGHKGEAEMVARHAPASVPLNLPGAIPWGDVHTYDYKLWTTDYWNAWLKSEWKPNFS